MAESVGTIYSTALYELCCEQNCLDKIYEEFKAVKELLYDNGGEDEHDLVKLLRSPLISGEDKTKCLDTVFKDRISAMLLDFLCLVAEKGRFGYTPEIYGEFRDMYNDRMGILEAVVITAEPLTEKLRNDLIEKLAKTTGRTVTLTEKTDKSIIGGVIVRYGNTEIDGSVRTRLEKLKAQINGVIA